MSTGKGKSPHLAIGRWGQEQAETFLRGQNMTLVAQNFRTRHGEIDLIMRDQSVLVFVEVKTRMESPHGMGRESVNFWKQRQLSRMALRFLQKHRALDTSARFDVIEVTLTADTQPRDARTVIRWFRDAFEFIE